MGQANALQNLLQPLLSMALETPAGGNFVAGRAEAPKDGFQSVETKELGSHSEFGKTLGPLIGIGRANSCI
jgi:hypothetical protein